ISFGDPLRSPVFASLTDTVQISGKAATINTEADSIKLFIGDQFILGVEGSVINYDFIAADYKIGMQKIILAGIDTSGITDTASFYIMINPPMSDKILPDNVVPGINITDANSVTLLLFAPYKEFVYVIGDFNDWMVDTSYFMNRYYVSEDSVVWWLQIDNLVPDTEYAFQYFVDGEIRIADPYTEKVLDSWNDKWISSATYPGLKPYPDGKTKNIVGVFETNSSEYSWQTTGYNRPEKHKLVIYELLIRDFVAAHDYATLIDTLDYLENLGINAIELMPFNEFEGNSSWGYNPSFYFAVDKYYGPANDLKAFIDECHQRGIAVLMDVVLNHAYGQNPWVRLYADDLDSSPWFNSSAPHTDFAWGYDFNHEKAATQRFVDRFNSYWMTEYKVDGFRFDFTRGFTNKSGSSGPYDASRIAILKRMYDEIRSVDSTAYVILEHLVDNNTEMKILADYGMMLWGNSHWNYCQASMGYTNDSDFSWGYYKSRGWTKPHLVTYMESHDE
ncbi:MAG: alpha-amylase, partial [Candidatus Marinimicrobia bacterium]|nr:alpha-amylase [Candidatus Neomarinimicrobiota bacterium]